MQKFEQNYERFTNLCEYFELGAVRSCVYLTDLKNALKNESLLAKIGFGTEENEPSKV